MLRHRALEIDQVFRDGRVGVVVGKIAVDLVEQQDMFARQLGRKAAQNLPGGAVSGIPDDLKVTRAVIILSQPIDIDVLDVDILDRPRAHGIITAGGDLADCLDSVAIDRPGIERHLKAVMGRRVV